MCAEDVTGVGSSGCERVSGWGWGGDAEGLRGYLAVRGVGGCERVPGCEGVHMCYGVWGSEGMYGC